jgi:hypothetical protein
MSRQKNILKKKDLLIFSYGWTLILCGYAVYPLIDGKSIRLIPLILSVLFFITGSFSPNLLKIPYKIWIKFGEIMGNIISKIVLFFLYYFVFTLFGAILKLLGKDLLSKKINRDGKSYWIDRVSQPGSMKNQF